MLISTAFICLPLNTNINKIIPIKPVIPLYTKLDQFIPKLLSFIIIYLPFNTHVIMITRVIPLYAKLHLFILVDNNCYKPSSA